MLPTRFKVTGELYGVPQGKVFKSKPAAMKYAESLSNVEVYDCVEHKYIYGTSEFYRQMKRAEALLEQ